ncbi:prephenate dehydrogenase [Desmospora profundinema]|uniref:Prephenate dehydrogenase n=1 Tax=Desmospora profundinema TaxID=1571184 RepID=A0ABU1II92_9BACL|nr:prephenate dehydrogenase [Desmospora profundinema]MDR6224491.1 prephenate dehydrogenase [Desmospora profundinema]
MSGQTGFHRVNQAVVIGIGLIGGSLAWGLREWGGVTVCGYDASPETVSRAQSLGVIDYGADSLEAAVHDADAIFLAAPVGVAPAILRELSRLPLKEDCIISDVGSTKGDILRTAASYPSLSTRFIGGHPMAGSHQSGVEAARPHLFENAYYVLAPLPGTPLDRVRRLSDLLERSTRARLVIMDPDHHDRVVGAISHLPHVLAAALVNQVYGYNQTNEWYHRLAAGGFRDLTRVAASDPVMWRDILLSNREPLLDLLDDWTDGMERIRQAILAGRGEAIEAFFRQAKQAREGLPERKKGMIQPSWECFVDLPDRPGGIGEVATRLGEERISIANIGVMESREERPGALRLVFTDQDHWARAKECLKRHGYSVFDPDTDPAG